VFRTFPPLVARRSARDFPLSLRWEAPDVPVPLSGDDPAPLSSEIVGGAHMSFSPDYSLLMDVVGHKTLWVSPVSTGKPVKVYGFPDGQSRIDYPVWSPDGKWVLFDRFRPQGSDIWMIKNFE